MLAVRIRFVDLLSFQEFYSNQYHVFVFLESFLELVIDRSTDPKYAKAE